MLDTLKEIQKNDLVNGFEDVASHYGLYGTYVNWRPGGLNEDGIYFVCGLDKDKVTGQSINIAKILEDQNKSNGNMCTDAAALCITGGHPFVLHHQLTEYCHKIHTISNIYKMFNRPIPDRISNESVAGFRTAWREYTGSAENTPRSLASKKLLAYIIDLEASDNKCKSEIKKARYLAKGYYDTGKGQLYNWAKEHFFKYKNAVSLTHLMSVMKSVNRARIYIKDYERVKSALDKRPDILYSFSKINGYKVTTYEDDWYSRKNENDKRYCFLYYPAEYCKDIDEILQAINYPAEFKRTLEDVDPHNLGTEHVIIPTDYLDMLLKRCKDGDVKICIDKTWRQVEPGAVAIAFSVENSPKVYPYISSIITIAETCKPKIPDEVKYIEEDTRDKTPQISFQKESATLNDLERE